MDKLRDEFARKVRHKATALQDIRDIVEARLAAMLARNPTRMDYQQKYEDIVATYNNDKDQVTIEETFAQVMDLMASLDAEERRGVEEKAQVAREVYGHIWQQAVRGAYAVAR